MAIPLPKVIIVKEHLSIYVQLDLTMPSRYTLTRDFRVSKPMTPVHLHQAYLSVLQQMLEGISGIDISLWSAEGLPLGMPGRDRPGMQGSPADWAGPTERKWVGDSAQTAVSRDELTITEAPQGGYYFFIPMVLNKTSLVIAGRETAVSGMGSCNAFSVHKKQYQEICDIAHHVERMVHMLTQLDTEKEHCRGKLVRARTVLRLLSHMKEQVSPGDHFAVFSDMLLYLYNTHTLAFMAGDGEQLRPLYATGRLLGAAGSTLLFDEAAWMVLNAMRERTALFFDNPLDIRCLGLDQEVTSVHLFPVTRVKEGPLFLCIFNTPLEPDDEREVLDLCRYLHFLISSLSLHESCNMKLRDMTILNFATAGLPELFDKPEVMYDSIVDTAIRLTRAERGSLMLAEQNKEELRLKAAHGINAWSLQDVRIRAGEGIAGRVFSESIPIMSRDIEKDFSVRKKPSYRTPSFMSVPLKVGDETIGVLNISDKVSGEVFNAEDLAFIRHFAHYASIAIKGASYYNLAEQLKELSITDPLTRLYNRRYFQERLTEEVDRSGRHQLRFSLAIIDIDDFKLYNDTEGHLAGDDMLKRLSQTIHGSLRAIDVFARIGGEEFAVIMPQTDRGEAFHVAERVCRTVTVKMRRTWKSYPRDCMTVSIGIASFPEDDDTSRRLFWKADKALYQAKLLGKNKVCLWDGEDGGVVPEP